VEGIEEEVTMVTVAWVAVCTEVGTIEVATEAKVCSGVEEPVWQVEAQEDQQAIPSSVLSLNKVSLETRVLCLPDCKMFCFLCCSISKIKPVV
jgi:hypothetical protein